MEVPEASTLQPMRGTIMRFKTKPALSPDTIGHRYTEVTYDGNRDHVFAVPPHWHKYHAEHMNVLSGRLKFTLEGVTHILTAESPTLIIPPWHTHSIDAIPGEPFVATEATDPTGGFKEAFFRDLLRSEADPMPSNLLYVLRASYDGDMYAALPGGWKVLDQAFVLVLGGLTKVVGYGWQSMGWNPGWLLPPPKKGREEKR